MTETFDLTGVEEVREITPQVAHPLSQQTGNMAVGVPGANSVNLNLDQNVMQQAVNPHTTMQAGTNSTLAPLQRSIIYQTHKPDPTIYKWNIKFSGGADGLSATEFVHKVKALSKSRGVQPASVLNGMPELLSGSASKWFRTTSVEKPFTDLNDFCSRFLDDFEPCFRVDTRLELLKKRLQRPDERVVPYFADMSSEFQDISNPPPETERIRIIRKNLLPHFITHLACQKFNTVAQLRDACKEVESSYDTVNNQSGLRYQGGATTLTYNSPTPAAPPVPTIPKPPPQTQNTNRNSYSHPNDNYRQQRPQHQNFILPMPNNNNRQSFPNNNVNPQQSGWSPNAHNYYNNGNRSPQFQQQNKNYNQNCNQYGPNIHRPTPQNNNPNYPQQNTNPYPRSQPNQQNYNNNSTPNSNGQNNYQQRNVQNNNRLSSGYQSFSNNLNSDTQPSRSVNKQNSATPLNSNVNPPNVAEAFSQSIQDQGAVGNQVDQSLSDEVTPDYNNSMSNEVHPPDLEFTQPFENVQDGTENC